MTLTIKHLKDTEFNVPMVIFPLKQYEALMEYIEDIEDRLSVIERINEPNVSQEEVDEKFNLKFGNK
ncbi:MAG: hypothetical protein WCH34_15660 [Bacteroidota bacterium]